MKKSEGLPKPKSLGHILNMEGSVETVFSDSIEQYGLGLQSFLSKSSHHLQQYLIDHSECARSWPTSTSSISK